MSQQYILRLNRKGQPNYAYTYDEENKRSQESEVLGWSAVPKDKEWTILLPAAWVYQTKSHVPSKNIEVLKQSIPYAIEEELSNDVEDNHFAFVALNEKEQMVSVISLLHLNQLRESVVSQGVKANKLLSELDFCPKAEGVVSVWVHDDQALMCFGEGETLSVDAGQVSAMLPVFAGGLQTIQSNKRIESEWLVNDLKARAPLQLSDCFEALNRQSVIDLMPLGWLKQKDENKPNTNKIALLMLLILVLSWVGIKTFQHIKINQDISDIKTQQVNLFTGRFGDASASELIDPYAALLSRMQRVNQSQSMDSPFLTALNHLGLAIQNHRQSIDILSLRLLDQKLEIQITAETMTLINRFQQSLQQSAVGFKVMIGVNEQDAGRFKSVITMEKL